jgi:hypothetical protein
MCYRPASRVPSASTIIPFEKDRMTTEALTNIGIGQLE